MRQWVWRILVNEAGQAPERGRRMFDKRSDARHGMVLGGAWRHPHSGPPRSASCLHAEGSSSLRVTLLQIVYYATSPKVSYWRKPSLVHTGRDAAVMGRRSHSPQSLMLRAP